MPVRPAATSRARVRIIADAAETIRRDTLVTEEPLEVRLELGGGTTPVAVTMRTPGEDFVLAAGLLFSEGIVHDRAEITRIDYCTDVEETALQRGHGDGQPPKRRIWAGWNAAAPCPRPVACAARPPWRRLRCAGCRRSPPAPPSTSSCSTDCPTDSAPRKPHSPPLVGCTRPDCSLWTVSSCRWPRMSAAITPSRK